MKLVLVSVAVAAALAVPARPGVAQDVDPHAGHAVEPLGQAAAAAQPGDATLPAGEEGAKARLDATPRHGEYVDVPVPGGATLRTWVSYPERKDKAPVVIVIHEIYGLTDWIRSVCRPARGRRLYRDRS